MVVMKLPSVDQCGAKMRCGSSDCPADWCDCISGPCCGKAAELVGCSLEEEISITATRGNKQKAFLKTRLVVNSERLDLVMAAFSFHAPRVYEMMGSDSISVTATDKSLIRGERVNRCVMV